MLKQYSEPKGWPVRGGCITEREKAQLDFGQFSWAQNIRHDHPGIRKRLGMSQLHTTALGALDVKNLYQYRSIRGGLQKVFAQCSDDDLYVQGSPTVPDQYAGAFGTAFHTGSANSIPASFATVKDHMLYANGVDQHQLYCGSGSLVDRFVIYDAAGDLPVVPEIGLDYSDQVRDVYNTTNVASIASMLVWVDNTAEDCILIMTKVPATRLTFDMGTANTEAATTVAVLYWNGAAWTAVTNLTDGTSGFGQDGTMEWDALAAKVEREKYMYGSNGFWYQIRIATQPVAAGATINAVTFDDEVCQPLQNVWDGNDVYGVEVQVLHTTDYYVYGAGAVDISDLPVGDKIYIACADPADGIYIDPGSTPNLLGTTITAVNYWNGTAFTAVSGLVNGTVVDSASFAKAGWLTFDREDSQPTQFNGSKYQAYWYEIVTATAAVSPDIIIQMSYKPYFDIEEFGIQGQSNGVWKDRACYSFNIYGPYIYVSSTARPMVLNGSDYGILKAGDGRYNRVVAQRKFQNELMVWQEELGNEGGCVTIFEGYSPSNFGKLVLTSKIGAMNAKSVAVVDGVMTSTKTEERLKTMAYFLSREGVCVTDGRTVSVVSDDIHNYFDPQETECINIKYKDKMWLNHDSAENVLRIGLVSGSAATSCNVFPVFDLTDMGWSFDTPAQDLSCMIECAADASATASNINKVQLGGGDDDGFIYRLNHGTSDYNAAVSTLIDAYIDMELNAEGRYMQLEEMAVRCEAQTAGDIDLTFYKNGVSQSTKSIPMQAEVTNNKNRRNRFYLNVQGDSITLRLRNNTIDESMNIFDVGVGVKIWEGM